MGRPFSEIAFAPSAKAVPQRLGARETYECVVKQAKWELMVVHWLAEFFGPPGHSFSTCCCFVTGESKRWRSRPPIGPGYRG